MNFVFLIHVTNKILMYTGISYTMYHTCKRPFILCLQPWKEVNIIYIIARETLILTLSTLLIKTNVFKQQLHCPRYSTWARQSNTWMCFFNVFSGKHVRIERLRTYNFWNSLFYKIKSLFTIVTLRDKYFLLPHKSFRLQIYGN